MNSPLTKHYSLELSYMCGVVMIILSGWDIFVNGEKNKELLFLISKKWMESPHNILVTKNLNWSQSLDKRTGCV
jgi:hypothetical protein